MAPHQLESGDRSLALMSRFFALPAVVPLASLKLVKKEARARFSRLTGGTRAFPHSESRNYLRNHFTDVLRIKAAIRKIKEIERFQRGLSIDLVFGLLLVRTCKVCLQKLKDSSLREPQHENQNSEQLFPSLISARRALF